jgi:CRP-like cAMP-binding protein
MTPASSFRIVSPEPSAASRATGNLLLDALPEVEGARLLERSRTTTLSAGDVLVQRDERISTLWFPVTAVVSLLTMLADGSGVETATVGREGVVGAVVFLGDDRMRNGRAVIQLSGTLIGVPVEDFQAVLAENGKLHAAMLVYTRALLFQLSQGVVCNAAHSVQERLARWLLQTTDRVGRDEIELTQQFLSEILHARRASVTDALAALERDDVVLRGRGRIQVRRRVALEAAACECYLAVRAEYDRVVAS